MKRFVTMMLALALALTLVPAAFAEKLTEEDVTFTIATKFNDSIRDMTNTKVWDYIYEQTGIRFERHELSDGENAAMMFSTREFTDFMSYGTSAARVKIAARDGDLMNIGEIIEEYCPTWQKIFEENPVMYNSSLVDGELYTLPYQIGGATVRDGWVYNKKWLDELGLKEPTTMDELTEVLTAVKNAAGTGSIPENVIPLYLCWENKVGGPFDIYGSFGVLFGVNDLGLVATADGIVEYPSVNPEIKDALKWIQNAVANGLIPMDCFTRNWSDYLNFVSAEPSVCFMYTSSQIQNYGDDEYRYLDAPGNTLGRPAYIRLQSGQSGNPLMATCIAKNENTEAHRELIGKFLEWAVQPENAMNFYWGLQGTTWDYNEDGKAYLLFRDADTEMVQQYYHDLGFNNRWFCYISQDWLDNEFYNPDVDNEIMKAWANEHLYKDNLPSWDPNVYLATLETDEQTEMNDLYSELDAFRKLTFATWFTTDADIDAEWDAYVEEMEDIGLDDYMALVQKAHNISLGK